MKIYINDPKNNKIVVRVYLNDTIYEVKKRYGNENIILKFDAMVLKDDKTIEDYGIEDEDILVATERVLGGKVGNYDEDLEIPTRIGPVKYSNINDGPFYLAVDSGMNLFGPCNNKKCLAYYKEVCSKFGYGIFDLLKDLDEDSKKCPKCPACEYPLLKLETCGFMNCKYSYYGMKFKGGKIFNINYNNSISEKNKLDYFKAGSSGDNESLWVELKLNANPL